MKPKKTTANKTLRQNQTAWDKLPLKQMRPDTNLIICQKRLFPHGRGKKLLYIGFGEGQNLIYLAEQGFECHGTEIARGRIDHAQKQLANLPAGQAGKKLRVRLKLVSSHALPFPDKFFDIVVAWQSLYYNNQETLRVALQEIGRVLKPGGKFLSSMLSAKQKLLCHKKIGPSTYHPSPQTGQSKCTVFCFKTKQQVHRTYGNFSNIRVGYYRTELFGNPQFHWVIYCERKNAKYAG